MDELEQGDKLTCAERHVDRLVLRVVSLLRIERPRIERPCFVGVRLRRGKYP